MSSLRLSEAQAHTILGQRFKRESKKKGPAKKHDDSATQKLALQLTHFKIPFEQEFRFNPDRRWRADFRLIDTRILIEIEGGIWSGGRHTRGKGYQNDCEKYNWAASNGWTVLRYSTGQVKADKAILEILKAVGK